MRTDAFVHIAKKPPSKICEVYFWVQKAAAWKQRSVWKDWLNESLAVSWLKVASKACLFVICLCFLLLILILFFFLLACCNPFLYLYFMVSLLHPLVSCFKFFLKFSQIFSCSVSICTFLLFFLFFTVLNPCCEFYHSSFNLTCLLCLTPLCLSFLLFTLYRPTLISTVSPQW